MKDWTDLLTQMLKNKKKPNWKYSVTKQFLALKNRVVLSQFSDHIVDEYECSITLID